MSYELIAIGGSWGGITALSRLLATLPPEVRQPIVVVLHRAPDSIEGGLASVLQTHVSRPVADAEDKDPLEPARIYLAPPDYHLLVERGWLALSDPDVADRYEPLDAAEKIFRRRR